MLKETLKNNEILLSESIKREEKIHNKYKLDILSAVKLNKELNNLIEKKNNEMSELEIQNKKKELQANEKIFQMENQSLLLQSNYINYLNRYDNEIKRLNEEKRKIINESNRNIGLSDEEKLIKDYDIYTNDDYNNKRLQKYGNFN